MTDVRIITITVDELDARIEAAVRRVMQPEPSLRLLKPEEAA